MPQPPVTPGAVPAAAPADTAPPPLRLLQRWTPAAARPLAAPLAPAAPGPWAGWWRRQLAMR